MRLPLIKMHGAENDFLFVEAETLPSLDLPFLRHLAQSLCARNTGLGADGLVVVQQPDPSATQLMILNSDGSFAATCGNALRCLGLLLLRKGSWNGTGPCDVGRIPLTAKGDNIEPFLFATERFATLESGTMQRDGTSAQVAVLMGTEKRPVASHATPMLENEIRRTFPALGENMHDRFVELANPHWVFLSPGFATFTTADFIAFGQKAQTDWRAKASPEVPLANIGMIWPQEALHAYNLVVFERGAGLTRCCGSGATAARVALEELARETASQPLVRFAMPGGEVAIGYEKKGGPQRLLVGPAVLVAELTANVEITPHHTAH